LAFVEYFVGRFLFWFWSHICISVVVQLEGVGISEKMGSCRQFIESIDVAGDSIVFFLRKALERLL
jgi:hypothetical protein